MLEIDTEVRRLLTCRNNAGSFPLIYRLDQPQNFDPYSHQDIILIAMIPGFACGTSWTNNPTSPKNDKVFASWNIESENEKALNQKFGAWYFEFVVREIFRSTDTNNIIIAQLSPAGYSGADPMKLAEIKQSRLVNQPEAIIFMIEDIIATLPKDSNIKLLIAGHSMGGVIAYNTFTKYRDRLPQGSKLALLAAAFQLSALSEIAITASGFGQKANDFYHSLLLKTDQRIPNIFPHIHSKAFNLYNFIRYFLCLPDSSDSVISKVTNLNSFILALNSFDLLELSQSMTPSKLREIYAMADLVLTYSEDKIVQAKRKPDLHCGHAGERDPGIARKIANDLLYLLK
jgi:pimeloyl-ACP methyl ester carboxylesterase